jgi:colanic acid/amylovoran biosynthesis glycosyltransferase
VAVYRRNFLAHSETFVRDHMLALRRYSPTGVAAFLADDPLPVPGVRVVRAEDRRLASRIRHRLPSRFHVDQHEREVAGLEALLRREPFDLVHAHFGLDASVAVRATSVVGTPLVTTFHGYDATKYDEVLARGSLGRHFLAHRAQVLNESAAIVAVSRFIADQVIAAGADPATLHVVPCGVDVDSWEWSAPPADGPLLFVGRMVEKKGLADLLQALAGWREAPELLVIGDGPLRIELERTAASLGVRATFLGVQPSRSVADAMRSSRLVVMPSKRDASGDCEGLPVASLEAASTGRPVVGYAHSGLVDSVLHGESGLLATEGDVEALRSNLQVLTSDDDLLLSFSKAGRRHVEEHFDIAATTAELESIYDGVRVG